MIFLATLFKSRGQQAVEIPAEIEFPDTVKKVRFRKSGQSLIVTPVGDSKKRPRRETPDE
ncbi:MAG TPA: hypothetical protein VHG29_07985 [Novosphingobium sp.]|nr:hypothetical protein [Novosphingobium sp.]